MKTIRFAWTIAAIIAVGVVAYAEEIKSGLQVGESAGAFNVTDCTGPAQGKAPLCYR